MIFCQHLTLPKQVTATCYSVIPGVFCEILHFITDHADVSRSKQKGY